MFLYLQTGKIQRAEVKRSLCIICLDVETVCCWYMQGICEVLMTFKPYCYIGILIAILLLF